MSQENIREFDDDKNTALSLEKCYAGLKKVQLMKGGLNDDDTEIEAGGVPFIYFQVVEGCGYEVTQMTPYEALEIANNLTKMANELMSLPVPKETT